MLIIFWQMLPSDRNYTVINWVLTGRDRWRAVRLEVGRRSLTVSEWARLYGEHFRKCSLPLKLPSEGSLQIALFTVVQKHNSEAFFQALIAESIFVDYQEIAEEVVG